MSLWDLLTVFAGSSALGGALGAAFAHVSGSRLALAAVWGVLLGFAIIAAMVIAAALTHGLLGLMASGWLSSTVP